MLGDDRFRKAARVVVDDAKNDEGTYASDSDAALAQSARAALVPFAVFIMACIRLSGRSPTSNDRRYDEVSGQLGASSSVAWRFGCQKSNGRTQDAGGAGQTELSPRVALRRQISTGTPSRRPPGQSTLPVCLIYRYMDLR